MSAAGYGILLGIAWSLAARRILPPRRILIGATLLQFALALFVFQTAPGREVFDVLGRSIVTLLSFVQRGTVFLVGESLAGVFAFRVLPTIIFSSVLIAIAYHFGWLPWIIRVLARGLKVTLGTSSVETLATAGNIFLGPTEAPLVVRPYIETMTRSELMALLVGGFATIAGSVLVVYVQIGIDAGHLITASVISAPAALLVAKILEPETDEPLTRGEVKVEFERTTTNVLHAISRGTTDGLHLAVNVGVMLLVFVSLVALVNAGVAAALGPEWSLERLFGYLFAPVAFLIGVAPDECLRVGELLGVKVVLNEFIAYERLAAWQSGAAGTPLSPRAAVLATYALCGFGNFGTMGIAVAGIGTIAPSRLPEITQLAVRAMIGGNIAAFLTACVAGIVLT
jgi:CNT family concentrative nucleoside transporter